jgi:hypothetical protein
VLEFGKRQLRLLFLSLKVFHASRGFRMSTQKGGLPTRAGRHLGLEPLGERDAQALDQAVCPRARKASSRIGCQACGR